MRHLKSGRKLNRTASHRDALFRNMVTSLLLHEQVHTTDAKAKELRGWVDRMITLGKRGTLHARRQAAAVVRGRPAVKKLFEDIAPRFRERAGGYTRIIKIGTRRGDAAPMSVIELTDRGQGSMSEAEKKRQRRQRAAKKKEQAGGGGRPPGT